METTNKCAGMLGEIFGHKFEAVYEREVQVFDKIPEILASEILEKLGEFCYNDDFPSVVETISGLKNTKQIYIHHICPRCGQTVKRP
jgi:hypothetical protein